MIDYAALMDRSPNPYMVLDRDLRYVWMNSSYLAVTGRTREELLGMSLFDAFPGDPDDLHDPGHEAVRELRDSLRHAVDTGEPHSLGFIRYCIPLTAADGGTVFEERFWSATHTPVPDADGRVTHVLQHTVDVTGLHRMETELAQRRATDTPQPGHVQVGVLHRAQSVQAKNRELESQSRHLLKLFEVAPGFMAYLSGPEHRFELANAAYLKLVNKADVVGKPVHEALPEVVGQGYVELLDKVYASGQPFVGRGMRVQVGGAEPGTIQDAFVDFVYQPVRDARGTVIGIFVQGHDITPQALAQAELEQYRTHLEDLVQARTHALEESEAALLQAQKMEAVGKLTGGVAHDFNNVLQVIGANLQLLAGEIGLGVHAGRHVDAALDAVERGAKLASQLLAFARQQPLAPVVLDLGERLQRLDDLLRRTLGERIELQVEIDPALSTVEADPHQLENAVLNLAINARDAMEHGGGLRIRARNTHVSANDRVHPELQPGDYVELAIIDTGHGMPDEVVRRAFEPFYTTKPEGRGTGLGLSMAYGFVRQSGGQITLDSAPGKGTTVTIHLPRSDQPATPLADPDTGPIRGGSETVLVVEDDAAVRGSVVETIRSLGYRVVHADDARSALDLLETGTRADLVFTDVVMPGPLQSPELARRARLLLPGVAVLFTSGYTDDVVFHGGRLDPGVELLHKPYRREDLARRLRHALDRGDASAAPRGGTAIPAASNDAGLPPQPAPTPAPVHGLRVVFAEDDADNRQVTAHLLSRLGHRVQAVGTAQAALRALEAGGDVLLTDVHLPDMHGVELARQARERQPALRVVLATGDDISTLADGCLADACLQKPYGVDALQAALTGAT
ncbi:response regulator [Lysobacter sp. A3-1-A15]|uniref:response regulator n=1 Tax=Novilysobacter viscosus TaxID=3098602 RepID=UPI003983BE63